MTIDEKYMMRCLQLANKGKGYTMPNPLVGAVIVDNGEIIGEGYHIKYGGAHAEVNAINSVADRARLTTSTIYVSLEPCSHYGKTPPCAELIVKSGISKVVVATTDPNPSVAGRGIKLLRDSGIEVEVGVLSELALEQNRVFFVNHMNNRPYVILKWAQSRDGYIDGFRTLGDGNSATRISNNISSIFVHKLRTEVESIMVGTNTAILDNPRLTSRNWYGNSPTRVVIDRSGRLPSDIALFNGEIETIVITENDNYEVKGNNTKVAKIDFSIDFVSQVLKALYSEGIGSVLIEGGSKLLTSFIEEGCWDEAYVEVAPFDIGVGVESPSINLTKSVVRNYKKSMQYHLKNKITQNIA